MKHDKLGKPISVETPTHQSSYEYQTRGDAHRETPSLYEEVCGQLRAVHRVGEVDQNNHGSSYHTIGEAIHPSNRTTV